MTVLFLEHSWWPVAGTESGPSDWRLLRRAPEGRAFTLSPSVSLVSFLSLVDQRSGWGLDSQDPGDLPPRVGSWSFGGRPQALGLMMLTT